MKHSRFVRCVTGLSCHVVGAGVRTTLDSTGARDPLYHLWSDLKWDPTWSVNLWYPTEPPL